MIILQTVPPHDRVPSPLELTNRLRRTDTAQELRFEPGVRPRHVTELLRDKREAETETRLGKSLRSGEVDHGVGLEGDGRRRRRSGHGSEPGVEEPGEGGLGLVEEESAAEEERLPVVVESREGGERELRVAPDVGGVEDECVAEVGVVRPAGGIGPENVSVIVVVVFLQCVGERWILEVVAFQVVQDVLQTHHRGSER
ncbi:Uncharacterized protein Rs2_37713 [Raphanus sativus]|nr:Uncharacterized protein Rs2_37713 [Raphanus sativus]